jgi:hypothetical protein
MKKANHPAIAVNWDIMHPVRRSYATIEESFEVLKPWIQHLHIHDGSTQKSLLPIGEGTLITRVPLNGYRQFHSMAILVVNGLVGMTHIETTYHVNFKR